jgi:tetratricopeptide (TPR) repeat protein
VNPADDIAFELLRQRAGVDLTPRQQAELQRLIKVLRYGSPFQTIFVEILDLALRERLITSIDEIMALANARCTRIDLGAGSALADVPMLEQALIAENARGVSVIHLVNADGWLDDTRLQALNLRREALAHTLGCRLVFWLPPVLLDRIACHAADLWSWRSGVYDLFAGPVETMPFSFPENRQDSTYKSANNLAERAQRIALLRQWLQQTSDDEVRLPLIDELAILLANMGCNEEALDLRRAQELPIYQQRGDRYYEALTQGKIADILVYLGQIDEAMDIYRNKALPVFQSLGTVNQEAITYGKIADILYHRGQFTEAMDLHINKTLSTYQTAGNVLGEATTHGKIADILLRCGRSNEAMEILRSKELPTYQRLGDLHGEAATYGAIANILYHHGQFSEAMEIYREKTLPVFQKLGSVHEQAAVYGRIADILFVWGQLDEAMDIHREKTLPVFQKLGDKRGEATVWVKMADILHLRGKSNEALDLLNQALTVFQPIGEQPSVAETVARITAIKQQLGIQ